MPSYFEFFCGGGMVRAGLRKDWQCSFANDFDLKKCETYARNWGAKYLKVTDVRSLRTSDLPEFADLAWASFPCQDLSLAGGGAGLKGNRSGTFWPFWKLMSELVDEGRAPKIIALENVCGTLTSHKGKDFSSICAAFGAIGYRVGAVVIDASHFVPQSRPRLFIIGARHEMHIPKVLQSKCADEKWHPSNLRRAQTLLSRQDDYNWIWWSLPQPSVRRTTLNDTIDCFDESAVWHSRSQTRELLSMMDAINRERLKQVQRLRREMLGTMYRRTRPDRRGGTIQRIEARFDGLAGCLRTPAGGSSRQLVIRVHGEEIQTRLMTAREAANLMGIPKSYLLPEKYNEAYHLVGDGVAVPVVSFLSTKLFLPLLSANSARAKAAA